MQTTIDTQVQPIIKKLSWTERRKQKAAASLATKAATTPIAPHSLSFYERAIEWTHRADKVINLVLGYLLAIASVLGFMDVLSNGQVLSQVPFMFFVWLGIMGLGVDFQILLVIGRIPDLFHMPVAGWQKWLIFLFNVGFLIFLAVMSIAISAVFTQHKDMAGQASITDAMNALSINSILFVYGRAALATLLLVLMAVDRTMERWRMQITATAQYVADAVPVLGNDIDKILLAIVDMNAQNIQAMRDMNQQTITQVSQLSVSIMEETVNRMTATLSLPGTPTPLIGQSEQEDDQSEGTQQSYGDTDPLAWLGKPTVSEKRKTYKNEVEELVIADPDITEQEISARVGCSLSVAHKWKSRCKVVV